MSAITKDLSDEFFVKLASIATRLETDSLYLLAVMMSESGVRANAHNPNGHASGLIQFMPDTLLRLGWLQGHEAFRKLSAVEQLPFVEAYFAPHRGRLKSIAAVYVATFLPAFIYHADNLDYVLCAKNGRLGWAYNANSVFDANKDLTITVRELQEAVERNCHGERWAEIRARALGEGIDREHLFDDDGFDLATTRGVQGALAEVGFDPGPIDGIIGPRTVAALQQFQDSAGLVPDGIYGPRTKEALAKRLGL